MLSLFPQLFDFQFYGPFILRLAAGLVFIAWGREKIFADKKSFAGWVELAGGIFLFAGLFMQAAAVILIWERLSARFWKRESKGWELDLLIFALLLAVLVLGPGIYAFDYPL